MSDNEKYNGGSDEQRERIERLKRQAEQDNATAKERAAEAAVLMDKVCQEMRRQQNIHEKEMGGLRREMEELREHDKLLGERLGWLEGKMRTLESRLKPQQPLQPRPPVQAKPVPSVVDSDEDRSSNAGIFLEIGWVVAVVAVVVVLCVWIGGCAS